MVALDDKATHKAFSLLATCLGSIY